MPTVLPSSFIISQLDSKQKDKSYSQHNYLSLLETFAYRVANEVSYINVIFPEYTPHNNDHHLSRLFTLGETILGSEVITRLNSTELLILSLSIYGHDWGMAVSNEEKQAILSRNDRANDDSMNIHLLPNEKALLEKFLKLNSLSMNDADNQNWQNYVRETHALRSGERVKKYFEKIDKGLGDAVAKVCEGHWLDFSKIEDPFLYPVDYSLCGEIVNLKALAIYLRLIDLFDLSYDRTPYVLWKYVSPKNSVSKLEWEKHRCINAISCPKNQNGRTIQVDGSTNSHSVYASLIDLYNYCLQQLKGCNAILNRINNPSYNLNIYDINWRIEAVGFKPISVQFEFDRSRMFEILSSEIYQGDQYVFLRELLQNSIDAITLRKELLKQKGIVADSIGVIKVDVEKLDDSITLVFEDDGIGMDEYIISRYFSVAGKSYYQSDEFEKLGIKMDPISKFGVGVLSCFMVTEGLIIQTFRDPYFNHNKSQEKLLIEIPSIDKQFRIEALQSEVKVGTRIELKIPLEKLKTNVRSEDKLRVRNYIAEIAGFVKYPILIHEGEEMTIIVSPHLNSQEIELRFPDYKLQKLDLKFPYLEAFPEHYVAFAERELVEEVIDIERDLELDGAKGIISFVKLRDRKSIISVNETPWALDSYFINKNLDRGNRRIEINDSWTTYNNQEDYIYSDYGESSAASECFRLYLDGILVPKAKFPKFFDQAMNPGWYRSRIKQLCLPFILINFNKTNIESINIARTETHSSPVDWVSRIKESYLRFIDRKYISTLELKSLRDRWLEIAQLYLLERVLIDDLLQLVKNDNIPFPLVAEGGKLEFIELKEFKNVPVKAAPLFYNHFHKLLLEEYDSQKTKKSLMDKWSGEEFLLIIHDDFDLSGNNASLQLQVSTLINKLAFEQSHSLLHYVFLQSPWQEGPPIIQPVYFPKDTTPFEEEKIKRVLLEKAIKFTETLTEADLNDFKTLVDNSLLRIKLPYLGYFQQPFIGKFAYGLKVLNARHHLTNVLIKVMAATMQLGVNEYDIISTISDLMTDIVFFNESRSQNGSQLNTLNERFRRLVDYAEANGLLSSNKVKGKITLSDFVEETVVLIDGLFYDFFDRINPSSMKLNKKMYLSI